MSADNLQIQIERHIEALDKSVHAYLTHIIKTELLAHTPLWASYIIFTFRAEMNAIIIEADEKAPHMLMRVIGYTRDGLCKTKYVDTSRKRTIWKNGIEFLHDPARFGITTTKLDAETKMRKELEALAGAWADLPMDEEWLAKVRESLDERMLRLISWL